MDTSYFMDKTKIPDKGELLHAVENTFNLWENIRDYTLNKQTKLVEEWNFPGTKYGWSFRIKDKKRAILYLLPRAGYFKVAFVFGTKAYDEILQSDIAETIKNELSLAKVYAEGRGIRVDIKDHTLLKDIFRLIDIKMKN